jgi:hypothetical protein
MRDPQWSTSGLEASRPLTKRGRLETAGHNSAEDVFGEIGLFLVVILGIVVAINFALIALHIA